MVKDQAKSCSVDHSLAHVHEETSALRNEICLGPASEVGRSYLLVNIYHLSIPSASPNKNALHNKICYAKISLLFVNKVTCEILNIYIFFLS